MNPKLRTVVERINEWCGRRSISYDIAIDEQDLQGVLLFKRDAGYASELMDHIRPVLENEGIYARARQVRSGVVLAFSLKALSESELDNYTGESIVGKTDFASKIDGVFKGVVVTPLAPAAPPDLRTALFATARELKETAFKFPTTGNNKRAGQRRHTFDSRRSASSVNEPGPLRKKKQLRAQGETEGMLTTDQLRGHGRRNSRSEALNRRLDGVFSELATPDQPAPPGGAEGLKGMGAEQQPADLFQRFNAALQELGTQMGVGPLQDKLKEQGIKWKKSEDGQALIFFVKNGDTGAPQPVARVGSQTLAKPQDFQKALSQMLDFSKGQAPGEEEQKQQEVQDVQKRLREIATNMAPQDPEKQAAVMKAAAPPGVPTPAPPAAGPGATAPGGGGGLAKNAGPNKPAPTKPQNPKVSNLAAQAKKPKSPGGSLGSVGPRPTTASRGPK